MLKGTVLAHSVFVLLLVVMVVCQDPEERSVDANEPPVEKEEVVQTRYVGCGVLKKITIEDISECRCTKLLVSGDVPRPDSSMRASSQWDSNHGPRRARIYRNVHGHLVGSWSSRPNNIYQWLQFDLGQIRTVTGVVTKGRALQYEQFVKSYKIRYSRNGATWYSYKHKVFHGNFDTETPKVNTFYPAIVARYIRINPRSWHNHISMRADVLGCL